MDGIDQLAGDWTSAAEESVWNAQGLSHAAPSTDVYDETDEAEEES